MMIPPGVRPTRFVAVFVTVLFLLAGLSRSVTAGGPHGMTMDTLAQAWKARHEKFRTGSLHWNETRWLRRGSLPVFRNNSMTPSADPVPAEDLTLSYTSSLKFDGEMMRYECDGPVWFDRKDSFRPHHHVNVWDGKIGKLLHGFEGLPMGVIQKHAEDLTQPSLWAIRTYFRMLHPQWASLEIDKFVLLPVTELVNGQECLVIETAPNQLDKKTGLGKRPWKHRYYISRDQGLGVVLYTLTSDDYREPAQEFSVEYMRDEKHGWFPMKWRRVDGLSSEPNEIVEAIVTEYEFNRPIAREVFNYSFPKNTHVRVEETSERYIDRGAGVKREITMDELVRGATYEDLLGTDSGQATRRSAGDSRRTMRWGAICVSGVLFLYGVRRWFGST